MFRGKIVRNVLIPAVAVVSEVSNKKPQEVACRPSELPIYATEPAVKGKNELCIPDPGPIEQTFSKIRKTVFWALSEMQILEQKGEDCVQSGLENADWLLKYLQEEENVAPKAGAIAVGGLTGLILGLRGGIFRRVLFSSLGALSMAAICYPAEATEYSHYGVEESKRYFNIAYNFINGVKKDDPPLTIPSLPKLPTNLAELREFSSEMGKSAISLFSGTEDQKKGEGGKGDVSIDPNVIVSSAYDEATSNDCQCPLGPRPAQQPTKSDEPTIEVAPVEDVPSPQAVECP